MEVVALFAMVLLAFLHGLLSTHFLTWQPKGVYRDQQPQAYAQRDYVRHYGIFLGIAL